MNKVEKKYLWQSSVLTLLGLVACYYVFYFLPGYAFRGYLFVPAFFYAIGLLMIHVFYMRKAERSQQLLNRYALTRAIRILTFVVLLAALVLSAAHNRVSLVLTFVAFYLVYLAFDTWFYTRNVMKRAQGDKPMKHEANE